MQSADAVELRVLGCLIEKQRTTPDAYPLSLNALRLACNQSTNRDPVVDYDEATIRDALARLYQRRWTRLAGAGRASKYRHLLDEALGLREDELALLAVLMLRGPQTPGELNQRATRLHPFGSLAAVQATLDALIRRDFAVRLERRPGQKEERYAQLLGGSDADGPRATTPPPAVTAPPAAPAASAASAPAPSAAPAPAPAQPAAPPPTAAAPRFPAAPADEREIGELREEVADLRQDVAQLRAEVAQLREALGG
jgi:uncharacterized protein YceH (UPF0502 family)